MLSWPADVGAVLQSARSLNTPINWQNVTIPANVTNGLNQVVVPVANGNAFYRLSIP